MKRHIEVFCGCLFFMTIAFWGNKIYAQVPANPIGLNPVSLKWNEIHTDKVRVIFPRGLEPAGQRVANVVHYLWDNNTESIGEQKHKVTILLQNQTILPNGFVTVGPFRSEFYMTPPQLNYTTDWLDILAIHEYRHVQQFGNADRGLTKLLKDIAGSWAWGGMFGLSLPRWYLEGDATGMETALSNSGRGRLPYFDMEYRSLLLNDIDYSYEKAAAGSLKDFVPNWYRLGYYMTTYARKNHGQDVWADVVEDAASFKGLIYPFGRALKNRTGLSVDELYQNTIQDLRSTWKVDEPKSTLIPQQVVNSTLKSTVINYTNPQYIDDQNLVAVKSGFNQIPSFVRINKKGTEVKLGEPGIIRNPLNSTLSYAEGAITWAEIGYDVRWINQTFSIIRKYDIFNRKKEKLTASSKYFSPALSSDASRIVAVETPADLQYNLVILDANTGEVLQSIPNPENYFYSYPIWSSDQHIVAVAQKGEKSSLQKIDLTTGNITDLTAPENQQISHPQAKGDWIYFSATYTGINNIYAFNKTSSQLYQITNSPLGAFMPAISPDGNKMAYCEFHPKGYNIMEMQLEPNTWQPFDRSTPSSLNYFEPLVEQEGGSIVEKVGNEEFQVKKFNKWSGIVDVHSWLPLLEPPIFGARILSDNKFSTLSMEAGGFYNVNEDEFTFLGNISYAELFPVINAGYEIANRSTAIYNFAPASDTTIISNFYNEEWQENRVSAGVSIPLNLTKGNFFNRLTLSARYQNINLNVDDNFDDPTNFRDTLNVRAGTLNQLDFLFEDPLSDTRLNAIDTRITFRSFRRMALQHINPRLGLNLDFRYRTTLGDDLIQGNVFLGRADVFLPGFGRNHSIIVNGMYQHQDVLDNYRFPNFFINPRGYDSTFGDDVFKLGFNYHMDLLYPDFALGGLAFIKRVNANVFYDYAQLQADFPFSNTWTQASTGVELTFNVRFFRLLEVNLGARYSYLLGDSFLPSDGRNQFDFLLLSITE